MQRPLFDNSFRSILLRLDKSVSPDQRGYARNKPAPILAVQIHFLLFEFIDDLRIAAVSCPTNDTEMTMSRVQINPRNNGFIC